MDDFSLNFLRVGIELDILKLFYDNYLKNKKKIEISSTGLSIIFKRKTRGITNPRRPTPSSPAAGPEISWELDFSRRHMTNHNGYKPY